MPTCRSAQQDCSLRLRACRSPKGGVPPSEPVACWLREAISTTASVGPGPVLTFLCCPSGSDRAERGCLPGTAAAKGRNKAGSGQQPTFGTLCARTERSKGHPRGNCNMQQIDRMPIGVGDGWIRSGEPAAPAPLPRYATHIYGISTPFSAAADHLDCPLRALSGPSSSRCMRPVPPTLLGSTHFALFRTQLPSSGLRTVCAG